MPLTEEEKAKIKEEEKYRTEARKEAEKKPLLKQNIGCGGFILIIIIIVIMIAIFSGVGEKKNTGLEITQPSIQKETASAAFKLASIEVGHTSPSSMLVKEFENLLNKLTRKCSEKNEERIADYIVKGKEMIEEKGGKTTLLGLAKAMDESIPEDMAGVVSCAEIAAALVVLMIAE